MSTVRRTTAAACLLGAVPLAFPVAFADPPGATPRDSAMTCAQIAAELAPYMQQMMPAVGRMAASAQEIRERGERRVAQETPAAIGLTAAATATMADPTGLSGKALGQAELLHQQEVWQRSETEDAPLYGQFGAQTGQVMAQAQQLQSNPRLRRLMQLAAEKHCDNR